MQEIDLTYEIGEIEVAEASSIVKRALENHASFQVDERGSPSSGSVTYSASANNVTVYEGPYEITISGTAEPDAADAIIAGIKSQAGDKGSGKSEAMSFEDSAMYPESQSDSDERGQWGDRYADAEFEEVEDVVDTGSEYTDEDIREAEREHGKLEAEILVYEDGHTHIYYSDGDDRHFHVDAGVFYNAEEMDIKEMYTSERVAKSAISDVKSKATQVLDSIKRGVR